MIARPVTASAVRPLRSRAAVRTGIVAAVLAVVLGTPAAGAASAAPRSTLHTVSTVHTGPTTSTRVAPTDWWW